MYRGETSTQKSSCENILSLIGGGSSVLWNGLSLELTSDFPDFLDFFGVSLNTITRFPFTLLIESKSSVSMSIGLLFRSVCFKFYAGGIRY